MFQLNKIGQDVLKVKMIGYYQKIEVPSQRDHK